MSKTKIKYRIVLRNGRGLTVELEGFSLSELGKVAQENSFSLDDIQEMIRL